MWKGIKTEVELGCFATFECLLDAFVLPPVECFSQIESPKGETRLSWKSQLVLVNCLTIHRLSPTRPLVVNGANTHA